MKPERMDLYSKSLLNNKTFVPREVLGLYRVGYPLAVSFAIENIMAFTDAIIIGRLSPADLAAFGIASRLATSTIYIACICIVGFVAVFASEAMGRSDAKGVSKSLRHALWLCGLLSLPVMVMLLELSPILRMLGQTPSVVVAGAAYGRAVAWMVFPYVAFSVLRDFTAAAANVRSVIYVVAAASVANLLLSWVLVHGLWIIPGDGIAGAGIAASAVAWGMFASELWIVATQSKVDGRDLFENFFDLDLQYFSRYFRLGLPLALNSTAQSALWISVQLLIGTFGPFALAANQVVFSFTNLIFVIPEAIREALAIQVARVRAEGQSNVRKITLYGVSLMAVYLVPISLAMICAPKIITSLFIDDHSMTALNTTALACILLGMAAVNLLVDGLQVAFLGSLKGLQDTRIPVLLGIVGYWGIGLPLGYLLAFKAGWGPVGLWAGLIAGLAVATTLLGSRYMTLTRMPVEQRPLA